MSVAFLVQMIQKKILHARIHFWLERLVHGRIIKKNSCLATLACLWLWTVAGQGIEVMAEVVWEKHPPQEETKENKNLLANVKPVVACVNVTGSWEKRTRKTHALRAAETKKWNLKLTSVLVCVCKSVRPCPFVWPLACSCICVCAWARACARVCYLL